MRWPDASFIVSQQSTTLVVLVGGSVSRANAITALTVTMLNELLASNRWHPPGDDNQPVNVLLYFNGGRMCFVKVI